MNLAPRPKGDDDPEEPFIPDFSEGLEAGLYLALLELLDEGLIITGDEVVLEANSAACRLLERDYGQIAGKPFADLFPSERAFLDARARLFIQGEMRGSLQVSLPGDRRRDLRFVAAARIRPGIHALILSPDLAAEPHADGTNGDPLWPRLAAALDQPVIVVDGADHVAAANSAALKVLGTARADLVGRPIESIARVSWPYAGDAPVARLQAAGQPALLARVLPGPKPDWRLLILPSVGAGRAAPPPPAPSPAVRPAARPPADGIFARLFADSPLPTLVAEGPELRIVAANAAAARLYGYPEDALQTMHLADLGDDEGTQADFARPGIHRLRRRNGSTFDVEMLSYPLELPGRPAATVFMHDLPDAPLLGSRLRLPLEAFDASVQAVLITDADNRVLMANHAFLAETGFALDEIKGLPLSALDGGRQGDQFYAELARSLREAGQWQGEIWSRRKSGEVASEWLAITAVRNGAGAILHHVAVFTDLAAKRQAESRADYLAHHDTLTGLPNRRLFETRFRETTERARQQRRGAGLLRIDLDGFKSINRQHGHNMGDVLLQQLARRLLAALPPDACLARERSDSFLALLPDVDRSGDVDRATRALMAALATPFHLEGHEIGVSASIGIALFPEDGAVLDTLMSRATAALLHARQLGGNNAQHYTDEMEAAGAERLAFETHLRRAVERDELELQFQPLVDARSGGMRGGEALLRWRHPDLGLIPFRRFAGVARDAGLLGPMGDWALHAACAEAMRWPEAEGQAVRLTVNICIEQLVHDDLATRVRDALAASGLSAGRLELDLDEAVLQEENTRIAVTLASLREMGVHLAIDDFGRGLASIPKLKRYPLSALKLDPSLVRQVGMREESEAVVEAIATMASVLGLEVFARGVEGEAQQAFLCALGCHLQQGPLFGRPMSAGDFRAFLGGGSL